MVSSLFFFVVLLAKAHAALVLLLDIPSCIDLLRVLVFYCFFSLVSSVYLPFVPLSQTMVPTSLLLMLPACTPVLLDVPLCVLLYFYWCSVLHPQRPLYSSAIHPAVNRSGCRPDHYDINARPFASPLLTAALHCTLPGSIPLGCAAPHVFPPPCADRCTVKDHTPHAQALVEIPRSCPRPRRGAFTSE